MSGIWKRTNMCGELRTDHVGSTVVLNGWVQKQRSLGGLIFCDLRDKAGIVQVVFNEDVPKELFEKAESLRSEYVVGIKGIVRERESKNKDLDTGDIEVLADDLILYSRSETPPIYVKDDDDVSENLRLKYRYLDLRKNKMQRNLAFRHRVTKITRDFFDSEGFVEVETPMLIKSTPEGARDYLVPSRVNPGSFYALPQSPQMYKQILMASGTDRYFQIVKCFRDEDLRADRQPEFTQIDLEMSFVDVDDVLDVQERFLKKVFKEALDVDIKIPFKRYSYDEAMTRFGSDKPDTRFGFELKCLNETVKDCGFGVFANALAAGGDVRAININGYADKFSRKDIDKLQDAIKAYGAKGLAWIKTGENRAVQSPIAKFFSDAEMNALLDTCQAGDGDLILMVADKPSVVFDSLGFLRRDIAGKLGLLKDDVFDLLWVVDFPLFEYNEDDGRYYAKHHPFTSPRFEDLDLLETEPGKVRAKAYDIVLNGTEIGGGSIRIHDGQLQKRMFKALGLGEEEAVEKFGFLIDAFKYGAPPHGGLAYGLDRLIMILCGEKSIREVIAFPKNQAAVCMLSEAPSPVPEAQLEELSIAVVAKGTSSEEGNTEENQ